MRDIYDLDEHEGVWSEVNMDRTVVEGEGLGCREGSLAVQLLSLHGCGVQGAAHYDPAGKNVTVRLIDSLERCMCRR